MAQTAIERMRICVLDQIRDGYLLVNSEFFSLMFERWPHYVHYRGRGKPIHCPPDHFGFIGKPSPTHCDWMVPGTYK